MKVKKLSITILTLFPEFISDYLSFGILKRAIAKKILQFKAVNLRNYKFDKRGTVDDRPYGGGVGMVLRPDILYKAITNLRLKNKAKKTRVIMLSPQGKMFSQKHAKRLLSYDSLIFVCGRYEGFDERVRSFVDEEFSIGDYVLMGGELPALVMSEAVIRLIPNVLGKDASSEDESFADGLLEYPHYTKPEVLQIKSKRLKVPSVLLSGHHKNIETWRKAESLKRTKKRRPDLLK